MLAAFRAPDRVTICKGKHYQINHVRHDTGVEGRVALVTGATRGIGKGVAFELAEAGAIVYATGRTIAEESLAANGRVIPLRCDHTSDSEVEALFQRITAEHDRLDILVNNVWGGYENMVENGEFTWMLPIVEAYVGRTSVRPIFWSFLITIIVRVD